MRCRLTVLHTDDGESYYDLGDDQEFHGWRLDPRGLVVRRHDGSRIEIPAAAIRFVDVRPAREVETYAESWRERMDGCGRCQESGARHWATSDGYPVCPDLVRPDRRGEPEWDVEEVLDELKTLMDRPTPDQRDRIKRRIMDRANTRRGDDR